MCVLWLVVLLNERVRERGVGRVEKEGRGGCLLALEIGRDCIGWGGKGLQMGERGIGRRG
jgi:hypothetical protein